MGVVEGLFEELGSPGGASKVAMTVNDPRAVKELPSMGAINRDRTRRLAGDDSRSSGAVRDTPSGKFRPVMPTAAGL
ncbi:hypothetical protein RW1_083_00110 [Rhodococcus wratislaviensis NBRC 100605]|uniref:Uncharacterized protein n=1 Tax=Rhodococcus wratislaviensis NBRC 100605 TaxID=1219028 RepID=X0Q0J6_RHOWR|nr:hypothetical protein RW1_083_00110 [Rhodococcus wratislaviensis NBRC 100605]